MTIRKGILILESAHVGTAAEPALSVVEGAVRLLSHPAGKSVKLEWHLGDSIYKRFG
jgi:hypothetical protein